MVIELPSYVVASYLLERIGRKRTLSLAFFLGGVGCAACIVLPPGVLVVAASMFGKFFITAAFGSVFVFTTELFPTELRSATMGLCSAAARVGDAAAPLVVSLPSWLPQAVFGCVALLASASIATLTPETLGQPLAETVAELEMAVRSRRAQQRVRGSSSPSEAAEGQEIL